MPADKTTIRLTEDRKDVLARLKRRTGENTNTGALFVAARHYLQDYENKQRHAKKLPYNLYPKFSTAELPLSRDTTVGRNQPDNES